MKYPLLIWQQGPHYAAFTSFKICNDGELLEQFFVTMDQTLPLFFLKKLIIRFLIFHVPFAMACVLHFTYQTTNQFLIINNVLHQRGHSTAALVLDRFTTCVVWVQHCVVERLHCTLHYYTLYSDVPLCSMGVALRPQKATLYFTLLYIILQQRALF